MRPTLTDRVWKEIENYICTVEAFPGDSGDRIKVGVHYTRVPRDSKRMYIKLGQHEHINTLLLKSPVNSVNLRITHPSTGGLYFFTPVSFSSLVGTEWSHLYITNKKGN